MGESKTLVIDKHYVESSAESETVAIQFINHSSENAYVTDWRTSCNCMDVSPKETVVLPGETIDVEVAIDLTIGGKRTVWFQPILQQSKDSSIVHLVYTVDTAGPIHVLDSVVMLGDDKKGILRMFCISPGSPSSEVLISTSEGVEWVLSGWSEMESSKLFSKPTGKIWQATVDVFGQGSRTSWIHIQTDGLSVGVYPVRSEP